MNGDPPHFRPIFFEPYESLRLFYSSFLPLHKDLCIDGRGTDRTDIVLSRFVEIRLPCLPAVRATDSQGLFITGF